MEVAYQNHCGSPLGLDGDRARPTHGSVEPTLAPGLAAVRTRQRPQRWPPEAGVVRLLEPEPGLGRRSLADGH